MRFASFYLILVLAAFCLTTYQQSVHAHQFVIAQRNAELNSIILEIK